ESPFYPFLLNFIMILCVYTCGASLHSRKGRSVRVTKEETPRQTAQLKSVPFHTCLKDRTYLRVPWERWTVTQIQKTQSTCFHHQMLLQVFNPFSTDHSQATWSHTALHDLLSSLHRCLGHQKPREEDNPACLCLGIVVQKDFQNIHLYLKEKKHSRCA
uniref:Uncharacterized protein n=1 Tax=Mustela putorius furo TaxID=9669 RepID=M3YX17_MUSPF